MSQFPLRFVTATSLFDGHDAAINIMRRILQDHGVEVIHLGHDRSVADIVQTAIQEDADAVAVSSYQGGHMEFFRYMYDEFQRLGATHIRIFGGGGGVIVPDEIAILQAYGIARIFSPEDGMKMGLEGMIVHMIEDCRENGKRSKNISNIVDERWLNLAHTLTLLEQGKRFSLPEHTQRKPVLGITGTGGAGKSTLTDELVNRFLTDFSDRSVAVLSVDPTQSRTGGALLGDRIRMNAAYGAFAPRVYMRSFATRTAHRAVTDTLKEAISACQTSGFDLVILETAGIGQSDTEIKDFADITLYVMTAEFGAPTQLEKIGMLDAADLIALNKFEKKGAEDALRDIRKQVQRNRKAWDQPLEKMPVYPTMASHFADPGVSKLYLAILQQLAKKTDPKVMWHSYSFAGLENVEVHSGKNQLIPPKRTRYLGEIAESVRSYHEWLEKQVSIARNWGQALGTKKQLENWSPEDKALLLARLDEMVAYWWGKLDYICQQILLNWDKMAVQYRQEESVYKVREREVRTPQFSTSLSGLKIPRVSLPRMEDAGERLRFALKENIPGFFPYTAGVFPFKRTNEDPTRMFAGEGGPERTNKRFHLLSQGMPAKRLSTAFDSVTLYGRDPHERPDIYGKIGNAGVSIATLDDMKKLYSGFDLCDPTTSVSMTINGPAPMILAMFMNTAIDQQVEKYLRTSGQWEAVEIWKTSQNRIVHYIPYDADLLPEGHDGSGLGLLGLSAEELVGAGFLTVGQYAEIKARTLQTVRGTVQADILKEDQAQNTCIFSTEFGLRMMGDVQQYFIDHQVRNYYSVSISGYHIAEAGANPISQLAFTLSNGFTLLEYYRSRGMNIDDVAPNFSFFFSNGLDPEYTVIGRVARRIWAIALRTLYGANERSQKLKYHIQTSGRSLHAQEIQFNDIRTTLQALLAIYDHCNSLHTNAYDEAITTPTEESVRRAMAIQLIINRELGLAKNENPLQGSFIVEELTDLVEEAVLQEFERISDRGGVLGAMETMYQRGKIQEESLYYEYLKHAGTLPIIGVNIFKPKKGISEELVVPLMRSTDAEKQQQLQNLHHFHDRNQVSADQALAELKQVALSGGNIFAELMETVKVCSLGQVSEALFEVGGRYRRNM
ncbi:MAG TPA: methylmalonyl-CoA mutase family protein [Rhodothermales bacterium]|nr:methylmalonyl-CoA mutase family protein [Rhodothermales bacterium]